MQTKLRILNYLFYRSKNYKKATHLKRIYGPLYESVFAYGIIHSGASKHIKPLRILLNNVYRSILNLDKKSSEHGIYAKMRVMRLDNLHKLRLLPFVFKNKKLFQFHDATCTQTRRGKVSSGVSAIGKIPFQIASEVSWIRTVWCPLLKC